MAQGRDERMHQQDQARYAEQRQIELRALEAADALDPDDHSPAAEHLREVAADIMDSYDPAERDRIIWGE